MSSLGTIAIEDTMGNWLKGYPSTRIDHWVIPSRPSSTAATTTGSSAIAFAMAHRTSQVSCPEGAANSSANSSKFDFQVVVGLG